MTRTREEEQAITIKTSGVCFHGSRSVHLYEVHYHHANEPDGVRHGVDLLDHGSRSRLYWGKDPEGARSSYEQTLANLMGSGQPRTIAQRHLELIEELKAMLERTTALVEEE